MSLFQAILADFGEGKRGHFFDFNPLNQINTAILSIVAAYFQKKFIIFTRI